MVDPLDRRLEHPLDRRSSRVELEERAVLARG